jgi:MOSC domain-containing protein YiiM
MSTPASHVSSVNVGRPRLVRLRNRTISTAIWKAPVAGRVALRGVNLDGDDQADRSVHGGPDKAVYAYAAHDTAWWEAELGRELGPGAFGENLTLQGVEVTGALIGERWAIGSAVLEVCQPRLPCFKLGLRMEDPRFPKRFAAELRTGAYARILEEGEIGAGDEVRIVHRPDHGVTAGLVAEGILHDHRLAARIADAPELSRDWGEWIDRHAAGSQA